MKKRFLFILPIFFSYCLTSCSGIDSYIPYKSNIVDNDDYKEIIGDGYYKPSSYKEVKYIYERDILGNIIGLIDYNGIRVLKYDYSAFGKISAPSFQEDHWLLELPAHRSHPGPAQW